MTAPQDPAVTPPGGDPPDAGSTQAQPGSTQTQNYDHDQHLLENPRKALEISKQAESERDRIRTAYAEFKRKAGNLATFIENGQAPQLTSWVNSYAQVRSHPQLKELAERLERGEPLPQQLQGMGIQDNDDYHEPEPWEKQFQELDSRYKRLEQDMNQNRVASGLQQFERHVGRYFREKQPHLADQDREELNRRVQIQIDTLSKAPTGAQTLVNMSFDQLAKFCDAELMSIDNGGAVRRALANEDAALQQQKVDTGSPVSIRTQAGGGEPPAEQIGRPTAIDVKAAYQRAMAEFPD